MAALMSSAPGPVPVHAPSNTAGGGSNQSRQTGQVPHVRQPTTGNDPQQSTARGHRTVRVAPNTTSTDPQVTTTNSGRTRATTVAGASGTASQTANTTARHRPTTSAGASHTGTSSANARAGTRTSNGAHPNTPNLNSAVSPSQSQARPTTAPAEGASTTRNSTFPHAFERWEMLSSRWEGLTGYWISKLEQNKDEFAHLPLEQQMSRQITDLSAAGANLFHAVVELQRLRASSERKFQRWFFETRADQERAREMSSELEATLRVERQKRAEAMATIARLQNDKTTAEKLVEECRRELLISREECRRAWEELGRREQEERERTNSLREGHPTLVGGVQVLPMPMPGVPSRSGSTRRAQAGTSQHGYVTQSEYEDDEDMETTPKHGTPLPLQHEGQFASGNNLELPSQNYPQASTAGATMTSTSAQGSPGPGYPPPRDQQFSAVHDAAGEPPHAYSPTAESFVTNEDDPGSYVQHREQSVTISEMSDEEQINRPELQYGRPIYQRDQNGDLVLDSNNDPVVLGYIGGSAGGYSGPGGNISHQDAEQYYGSGYGYADYTGWSNIQRHHHPTRLSDVVEEEERTQTSASDR